LETPEDNVKEIGW